MTELHKVRLSLTLSSRMSCRMDDLQILTEAPSAAEVIRSALRLYDYVVTEDQKGNEFCVRNMDGNITPVKFL